MTQIPVSTDPYENYIARYRSEEPVRTVIKQAQKIRLDKTIFNEIKSYRVFKSDDIKHIKGPEDYEELLKILDSLQRMKDRVCEIQLNYMSLKHDIDKACIL